MSELTARPTAAYPFPSTTVTVVCLFCLIGLIISAAVVRLIPAEDFGWVLSHIE